MTLKTMKDNLREFYEYGPRKLLVGLGLIGVVCLYDVFFLDANRLDQPKARDYIYNPLRQYQQSNEEDRIAREYARQREETKNKLLNLIDLNENGKIDRAEYRVFQDNWDKINGNKEEDYTEALKMRFERRLTAGYMYYDVQNDKLARTQMEALIRLYEKESHKWK
jgi:hypothetical protein